MSLSNSVGPETWNAEHRNVGSAIRKLGISREEAAELQGYIKRLLDEDRAVRKGCPLESLLVHRYRTDWKHLRIWREELVVEIEPFFKKCVEAVRDGVNLSRSSVFGCPPSGCSSAPTRCAPVWRQPCSGYDSGSESPPPTKSRGSSISRDRRFASLSSQTAAPICSQDRHLAKLGDLPFRRIPLEVASFSRHRSRPTDNPPSWRSASRSKSSSIRSSSVHGRSDPDRSSRGRKYPPIVERQYSLPVAHSQSRSSSSSRATSPILPSDFAIPPYSLTAPYQPKKASCDFSPPNKSNIRDFTFTEHVKSESYRTRSWYPEPHPIYRSTASFVLPPNPHSEGLVSTMDTTIPTTPRQHVPSRKPVPSARSSSSNETVSPPLSLAESRAHNLSSPIAEGHNHHRRHYENLDNPYSQRHEPKPNLSTTNGSPDRSGTLPNLPIVKDRQAHNARGDLVDELCPGKKRDMTPDFEIVPVTRLSPHSQSSRDQREQSHRRARANSRSRVEEHGTGNRQSDRSEEREGGSWRNLVCCCCGSEH